MKAMKSSFLAVIFLIQHLSQAEEVTPVVAVIFPSRRDHRTHISEFTDPKTGHNPYVDLKEGTPSSASRSAALKEERSHEVGRSEYEDPYTPRFGWNSNPHQTHVLFPSSPQHSQPRVPVNPWSINPIEGDVTHRSRQPSEYGQQNWRRPVQSWNPVQRPGFNQGIPPSIPSQYDPPAESPYIPRTYTQRPHYAPRTSPTISTTMSTQPTTKLLKSSSFAPSTTSTAYPKTAENEDNNTPAKKPLENGDIPRETILSQETKWTLAFCGIISGVAVVFFATLLAVCMYKQRRRRFVHQGSRFIEDSDIQTFGKSEVKTAYP